MTTLTIELRINIQYLSCLGEHLQPVFHPFWIDIENFYQIENEYGNIESSYGQSGKNYVKWAAEMALGLGAGVPWVMCKQADAPGSVVSPAHSSYWTPIFQLVFDYGVLKMS